MHDWSFRDPDGLRDIGYLTELLRREGITSMHFVPSLLGLFLSLPGVNQWRTLRRVPIGGEPLPGEIADKFHATFDALLYNFYGPTETIVNATSYPVEGAQGTRVVPIGRPKINTQIHSARQCFAAGPGRCDRRNLHRRNACGPRLPSAARA